MLNFLKEKYLGALKLLLALETRNAASMWDGNIPVGCSPFAWLWHVESQQVLVFPTEKEWGYIYYLKKYLD